MKFLMIDGTMREATKDCECLTHVGPHWVYMDNFWLVRNKMLLAGGTHLAIRGFITEELARLQAKSHTMQYLGIEQIVCD